MSMNKNKKEFDGNVILNAINKWINLNISIGDFIIDKQSKRKINGTYYDSYEMNSSTASILTILMEDGSRIILTDENIIDFDFEENGVYIIFKDSNSNSKQESIHIVNKNYQDKKKSVGCAEATEKNDTSELEDTLKILNGEQLCSCNADKNLSVENINEISKEKCEKIDEEECKKEMEIDSVEEEEKYGEHFRKIAEYMQKDGISSINFYMDGTTKDVNCNVELCFSYKFKG